MWGIGRSGAGVSFAQMKDSKSLVRQLPLGGAMAEPDMISSLRRHSGWKSYALGGVRRATWCLIAGFVLSLGIASIASLERSAQYQYRFGYFISSMFYESHVMFYVAVKTHEGRRAMSWERSILWDSVRFRRLLPSQWLDWGTQAIPIGSDFQRLNKVILTAPSWAAAPPEDGEVNVVETVAYGWPIRVLRVRGQLVVDPYDYTAVTKTETDGLGAFEHLWVAQPAWVGRPAWGIAWYPIWSLAALSAILYGVILWIPVTTLVLARSWLKVRSGKCVRCGYNLTGSPLGPEGALACPECGRVTTAVARRELPKVTTTSSSRPASPRTIGTGL